MSTVVEFVPKDVKLLDVDKVVGGDLCKDIRKEGIRRKRRASGIWCCRQLDQRYDEISIVY